MKTKTIKRNYERKFLVLDMFSGLKLSIIKGFNLVYHSTQSNDYLWYQVLREKKNKKLKHTRLQSSSTLFKWSEQ